jgi:hypothetical protein
MKSRYSFLVLSLFLVVLSGFAGCKQVPKPASSPALQPVPERTAELIPAPGSGKDSFVGTYKAIFPATASFTKEIILTLNPDNTAEMSSDSNYMDNIAPIVEKGTWSPLDKNSIHVTLVVTADGKPIEETIAFVRDEDELVATRYDRRRYGAEGLRLEKQKHPQK